MQITPRILSTRFKKITLLTFTLFTLIIWNFSCATTEKSPEIPDVLSSSSDAVFKIVFLSKTNTEIIPQEQYEFLIKEASHSDFLSFLRAERIKECKKNNEKKCKIFFAGFASAFLAENQTTLISVRHAFDPIIPKKTFEHETLLKITPHFILFDKYKNIVFDTRKHSDQASFIFIGNPSQMQEYAFREFLDIAKENQENDLQKWTKELQPAIAGKLTDFVKLRLSRSIPVTPLQFTKEPLASNSQIFLLGYPTRSPRQTVYNTHYYDGHSFHISRGQSSSAAHMFEKIFSAYNVSSNSDNKMLHLFEKYFFYHSAPSAEGFSGGPILNTHGEVVSIQSSGTEEGGFGLNLQWISTLESHFLHNPSDQSKQ